MKTVSLYPLHHGRVATVDDDDLEIVSRFRWRAAVRKRPSGEVLNVYAVATFRRAGRKESVLMHRLITGASVEEQVDHEDSDGLNNRRQNLRKCTPRQNLRNMRDRPGTSSFKGVSWHAQESKWRATIRLSTGQRHLGLYDREEDAARIYDASAKENFGEFARYEFP